MENVNDETMSRINLTELRRTGVTLSKSNGGRDNSVESIGDLLQIEDRFSINIPNARFERIRNGTKGKFCFGIASDSGFKSDQSTISALTANSGSATSLGFHSSTKEKKIQAKERKNQLPEQFSRFLAGSLCSEREVSEDSTWYTCNTFSQLGDVMPLSSSLEDGFTCSKERRKEDSEQLRCAVLVPNYRLADGVQAEKERVCESRKQFSGKRRRTLPCEKNRSRLMENDQVVTLQVHSPRRGEKSRFERDDSIKIELGKESSSSGRMVVRMVSWVKKTVRTRSLK
mmetsp:Transcript_17384/g.20062  ORF Transcript_17384/g.20062 Transcript_17384/m.20062 type:complete len:286 (+) Transcript_17384:111-968(+)